MRLRARPKQAPVARRRRRLAAKSPASKIRASEPSAVIARRWRRQASSSSGEGGSGDSDADLREADKGKASSGSGDDSVVSDSDSRSTTGRTRTRTAQLRKRPARGQRAGAAAIKRQRGANGRAVPSTAAGRITEVVQRPVAVARRRVVASSYQHPRQGEDFGSRRGVLAVGRVAVGLLDQSGSSDRSRSGGESEAEPSSSDSYDDDDDDVHDGEWQEDGSDDEADWGGSSGQESPVEAAPASRGRAAATRRANGSAGKHTNSSHVAANLARGSSSSSAVSAAAKRPARRKLRMDQLPANTAFKREVAALKRDAEGSAEDDDFVGSSPVGELAPGLVGLKNLRNTCFVNVIIQAISRLGALRRFMSDCDLPDALMHHVMNVVEGMWAGDEAVMSPLPLLQAVEEKYGHRFGQEEDAHWFMELILQDLRDSLTQDYPRRVEQLGSLIRVATVPLEVFPQSSGRRTGPDEDDVEPATSLADSLAKWRRGDDVLWSPNRRHAPVAAGNSSSLRAQRAGARGDGSVRVKSSLPKCYCFHFDRTRWTGRIISRATRSAAEAKVSTPVSFPLQLGGDVISGFRRDASVMFDLVAMVVHDGLTPATGHYYVYLRHSEGRRHSWYKFDDAMAPTAVSKDMVLHDEPFLLFYEQARKLE